MLLVLLIHATHLVYPRLNSSQPSITIPHSLCLSVSMQRVLSYLTQNQGPRIHFISLFFLGVRSLSLMNQVSLQGPRTDRQKITVIFPIALIKPSATVRKSPTL